MNAVSRAGTADGPVLAQGRPVWWIALLLSGVLACWGIYAYSYQFTHGEIVTGMRTVGLGGVGWGLYIAFYVVFIGISFAGITVASLIRLFGLHNLEPVSRLAELMTIIALVLGSLFVMADLGQPLHGLLNLPKYARTMSPFFGTFTMVMGGYLFASLVYFFLAGRADARICADTRPGLFRWFYLLWASGFRGTEAEMTRHHKASFWMSVAILPLLVTAHSTLGFVFGIQGGRPGWFSALQAPGFVVMAGVSGIGMLIVLIAVTRWALGLEKTISLDAFRWLSNALWILIVVYLYFIIVEELTANYAAATHESEVAHEVVMGAYAPLFWTAVGCLFLSFLMLFLLYVQRRVSIAVSVFAGLLVNVAAVLKRFLIVVPSQTHGSMLSYPHGHYSPTWVEYGVILGMTGMAVVGFLIFARIFPVVPVAAEPENESDPGDHKLHRPTLRHVATWSTLALGLVMATSGFVSSARWDNHYYADPSIPFAPVLFILGVMVSLLSAVVFEVLPSRRKAA